MIKLDTNIHGTIKLDDCIKSFDFKDNKLFIHPTKEDGDYLGNLFKLTKEHKNYKYLVGMTYNRLLIYFIDVVVIKEVNVYYAYPKAYIIMNSNITNWNYEILNFKKIRLKSSAIDALQNIEYSKRVLQHIILKENDLIEDKITKKFEISEGKCELNTGYTVNLKDYVTPINIHTDFDIFLNEKKSVYDVYVLVNKINEVFKFIFNRFNISFSSIQLETEKIPILGVFETSPEFKTFPATMFVLNQSNEFISRDINQTLDLILNNFNSLINVVNKEIISYYPKNDEDFHYVDVENFIKVCGTFEREFEDCFPVWLEKKEPNYTFVKEKILNYLDQLDEELKGKKGRARKKISSFRDTISNMNEKLEKRLNYAFDEFAFCLQPRFEDYCKRTELADKTFNEVLSCFANKRNKYVHTFNDLGFSKEEIAGFVVVRELIYCMVLKQAGFTNEEIEQMINIFQ